MSTATHHPIARDFDIKTRRALLRKGIVIVGCCNLPGDGPMPFANGTRGYQLDNNGEGQIRERNDVIALAR